MKNENKAAEADWRIFRELRELALERFCERILKEIRKLSENGGSYHEVYGEIYTLVHKRDKQIAAAFDDARRSRMLEQLMQICRMGLLAPDEIARFSEITQDWVSKFAGNEPADKE